MFTEELNPISIFEEAADPSCQSDLGHGVALHLENAVSQEASNLTEIVTLPLDLSG